MDRRITGARWQSNVWTDTVQCCLQALEIHRTWLTRIYIREFRCLNQTYFNQSNKGTSKIQPLPKPHCKKRVQSKLTLSNASCSASLRARVLASMGIPTLSQVPPGPNRGDAGPTCDRGFPCTRMWRQTSSSRARPDSILSHVATEMFDQSVRLPREWVQWLLPSASSSPL